VDGEGHLLRVNQRPCAIAGYTPDQLREAGFFGITHPEDADRDREQYRRLFAGEIPL
jgi:PAS domain S-box-containing protein